MTILIASDYNSQNTYVNSIASVLKESCKLICDVNAFWDSNIKFDIVHIQWPEELFNWLLVNEDAIKKLKERLVFFKNMGAKIVLTRHNEKPHKINDLGNKLYETVLNAVDGVIHLGNYSLNHLKTENALNVLIPHVNYNHLVEAFNESKAKQHIGFSKDAFIYMTFGAIRNIEEELQIIEAFNTIKTKKDRLFINNTLLMRRKENYKGKTILYLKHLTKTWLYILKGIKFGQQRLSNNELKYYFNASNVVVIPRIGTLNSGVVFMAMSFGKTIVGPNIGNISELLKQLQNPTFTPLDNLSISQALFSSKDVQRRNIGKENKKYSDQYLAPRVIVKMHLKFYNSLLK